MASIGQPEPGGDERGRAAELVDQVVHVARDPVPLQVVPAELAGRGSRPSRSRTGRPGGRRAGRTLALVVEEALQLAADLGDPGLVPDRRLRAGRRSSWRPTAERLALSTKTTMTTRWSRSVHDLLLRVASSREWGQGAVEVVLAVPVAALDVGLAVVACAGRSSPWPAGPSRGPRPFSGPKAARSFGFSTSDGQRAEPLAGGEVEEVAQQAAGAEPRVVLVLAQALDQLRQSRQGLLTGEVRRVARRRRRCSRGSPSHWPIAVNWVNERRKSPCFGSWFQPSNG